MRSRLAGPYIEKEAEIKKEKANRYSVENLPRYYLQARPGLRNHKEPEIFE